MEIARYWRLQNVRYKLLGEIGPNGIPHFPPGKIRHIERNAPKHQTGKETEVIFSSKEVSMSSR